MANENTADKIIQFPGSENLEKAADVTPLTQEELNLEKRKIAALEKLGSYRGTVASKNSIRKLPNVKKGEVFWVELDHCAYVVADKDKEKIALKALDENASLSTGITIFEMNKAIVSKEPLFDKNDEKAKDILVTNFEEWVLNNHQNFYVLYGRDIHYVTLFDYSTGEVSDKMYKSLEECISDIGDLISMDFSKEGEEAKIEIWIRTQDSLAELLYFFPGDKIVVKV